MILKKKESVLTEKEGRVQFARVYFASSESERKKEGTQERGKERNKVELVYFVVWLVWLKYLYS